MSVSRTFNRDGVVSRMIDEVGPEFRMAQRHRSFCVRPVTHTKSTTKTTRTVSSSFDYLTDGGGYLQRNRYSYAENPDVWSMTDWGIFKRIRGNVDPNEDVHLAFSGPNGLGYCKNLVLQDVYSEASSADYNLPVAAKELEKSFKSVDRLVSLMPRFSQWCQKNKRSLFTSKGFLRATGSLAQQWLEYRFGFMQLAYDYQSLVKCFNRGNVSYRTHVRSAYYSNSGVVLDAESNLSPILKQVLRRFATRRDTIRAGLIVRAEPLHDVTRSLGLHQPLTYLWEVTPFSFVLDYFVDMSSMLASLDTRLFMRPVASWVSHKLEYTSFDRRELLGTSVPWGPGRWGFDGEICQEGEEAYVSYTREISPIPVLTVPPWKPKVDLRRAADLVSLLRGLRWKL